MIFVFDSIVVVRNPGETLSPANVRRDRRRTPRAHRHAHGRCCCVPVLELPEPLRASSCYEFAVIRPLYKATASAPAPKSTTYSRCQIVSPKTPMAVANGAISLPFSNP